MSQSWDRGRKGENRLVGLGTRGAETAQSTPSALCKTPVENIAKCRMKSSLKEKGTVQSHHPGPIILTFPAQLNQLPHRAWRGPLHVEERTLAGQLSLRGLLRENQEIARMNEPGRIPTKPWVGGLESPGKCPYPLFAGRIAINPTRELPSVTAILALIVLPDVLGS